MDNKVGKFIRQYRGNTSLREFAKKCDISHTHLDSIEKGYDPRTGKPVSVTVDTLKKIASAMNMTINELFVQSGEIDMQGMDFNFEEQKMEKETIKIPVLGKIPAGIPIESIVDILGYEEIPKNWLRGGNKYFALKLKGNSMEPEYHNDDIVIFKQTNTCESGQDCCIRINGFDATFKRIKKQDNGILVLPLNENNDTGFNTTFFTNEDIINKPVEVIGVVKQIRRNI